MPGVGVVMVSSIACATFATWKRAAGIRKPSHHDRHAQMRPAPLLLRAGSTRGASRLASSGRRARASRFGPPPRRRVIGGQVEAARHLGASRLRGVVRRTTFGTVKAVTHDSDIDGMRASSNVRVFALTPWLLSRPSGRWRGWSRRSLRCWCVAWRSRGIGFSAGAPARSRPAPQRSRRHRCERRVPRRCDRPSHLVVLHGGPRPDEIGDRTIRSDGAASAGRRC